MILAFLSHDVEVCVFGQVRQERDTEVAEVCRVGGGALRNGLGEEVMHAEKLTSIQ